MKSSLCILLCAVFLTAAGCARLEGPEPVDLRAGAIRIRLDDIKTWKDFRDRNIVMQQFDYSCGAAAMATLMDYYFGDKVSEKDVLIDILKHINEADFKERKKEGLSLLDLKQFAERRGYQAAGVKLQLSALPQLKGPVLVYLERKDFKHFAIFRGVREDRVYLADPSRGNVRMPVDEFAKEWPGIALVLGKKGFGTPSEYPLAVDKESPFRPELRAARHSLYL